METSKAEPAYRNQAKAKLNRDAYMDSFPYVESYMDRYAYVESSCTHCFSKSAVGTTNSKTADETYKEEPTADERYEENQQLSEQLLNNFMIEHAEPLGSLGLNGAGDDPVDFVLTGGEDL
ncbi:GDSL esterase/lipase [Dorcoceras hygrometricum]|uniref:GDSL esterase/lipase n=1 Tax=Dorcoceras hygrometricum TaxID=472368 RepID=A0A2Z7D367_9LAMI|nr:GDSL esterase/lipase [Dorcoceras hygrometricum]